MSEKNQRIACSVDMKSRFDKVQADLLISTGKKHDHEGILDYLLKLHESPKQQEGQ